MPTSVIGSYSGDAAEFARSLAGQPWLILAAVITIYIVLGVLYESFIHPITILSTLPSAGVGALLALMLLGYDLSVIALIGIVLLMGIVKKNAIMMIDFALEAERMQGMTPRESIVQAALLRFRPIMMTTLAALFGAIPLAVESGTGSELRNPLGITIIGGLLLSQLLTLYTTPVIYLQMERLRARFSRNRRSGSRSSTCPTRPNRRSGRRSDGDAACTWTSHSRDSSLTKARRSSLSHAGEGRGEGLRTPDSIEPPSPPLPRGESGARPTLRRRASYGADA